MEDGPTPAQAQPPAWLGWTLLGLTAAGLFALSTNRPPVQPEEAEDLPEEDEFPDEDDPTSDDEDDEDDEDEEEELEGEEDDDEEDDEEPPEVK